MLTETHIHTDTDTYKSVATENVLHFLEMKVTSRQGLGDN